MTPKWSFTDFGRNPVPRKKRSQQTKLARNVGLGAIVGSLLVLPLFGMLMPSNAAEQTATEQAVTDIPQDAPEFELFVDPAVLEGDIAPADPSDDLVSLSDGSDIPAVQEISRDNGIVADSSPDNTVSRPAQNAVAMVGDYPVKQLLEVNGPFEHGDWVWNEAGAPAQGKLLITVNLEDQVMSVYRDGYEIGTAVILYGADEKPTPTGQFSITEKDIDHVSNLYFAPMPYMLRLTNDGIAIHGSQVEFGYATHGCIGIPDEFAAQLFKTAKLGDRVIINA
ncbi:MAG: L,D-transpeptidase family protein [Pseudomonadota bacterium]